MLENKKTDPNFKLREYCGLAGSYSAPGSNVTNTVIEMGKALQHRGQNGGGVGAKGRGKILKVYKRAIAFNELFRSIEIIDEHSLRGEIAIAHLRYPTEGSSRENCDAQPFHVRYKGWELALGHNGSIVDIKKHLKRLEKYNINFESDSDSEILAWLIVTATGSTWKQKISNALNDVQGAYCLIMVTGDDKLMALRDPWGVRPLVWSQDNGHVFIASETCALDRIGVRHSKELKPGQLIIADKGGVSLHNYAKAQKESFCVFERLYFSHETSKWGGIIGENRSNLGKQLALEEIEKLKSKKSKSVDIEKINFVVAVPDTARPGAHAFYETLSKELGTKVKNISYIRGLAKERYDWARRSFIEDDPYLRKKHIEKKFFVSPSIIGKSIFLIDDTAVRLNTFKILVQHLKEIGVKEIHCRFLAPKFLNPCFLGVNIGSRDELGAVKIVRNKYEQKSEEEIAKELGVSSLNYLSIAGMAQALGMTLAELKASHCTGCLDYDYPFDMKQFDKSFSKTSYLKYTETARNSAYPPKL